MMRGAKTVYDDLASVPKNVSEYRGISKLDAETTARLRADIAKLRTEIANLEKIARKVGVSGGAGILDKIGKYFINKRGSSMADQRQLLLEEKQMLEAKKKELVALIESINNKHRRPDRAPREPTSDSMPDFRRPRSDFPPKRITPAHNDYDILDSLDGSGPYGVKSLVGASRGIGPKLYRASYSKPN